jgi:polar amino acid transport system substrate-binding protein
VDAVILEQRVFYYYLAQLANSKYGAESMPGRVRYDLFAPTHYHFAFRQATQQRWFDRRLDAMRADGRYQRIFARYGATLSLLKT